MKKIDQKKKQETEDLAVMIIYHFKSNEYTLRESIATMFAIIARIMAASNVSGHQRIKAAEGFLVWMRSEVGGRRSENEKKKGD